MLPTRFVALLGTLALVGLTACSPPGAVSTPPATTSVTQTREPGAQATTVSPSQPPSDTPTPATPALGSWTARCSSPDADATALTHNLTIQPAFRGKATPSAEPGWADALAVAVKPLVKCPTAHLLAVAKAVTFGDDKRGGAAASARIVALAKGRILLLSGTHVGRIALGASQREVTPVLTAIMGPPKTSTQTCEVSGQTWNVLDWGDFRLSFLRSGKGAGLDSWSLSPKGNTPPNLRLQDDLPLRATFVQLKAFKAGLTQEDVFGTGGGPWMAEVRPGLRYLWLDKGGRSITVEGGNLRGCE